MVYFKNISMVKTIYGLHQGFDFLIDSFQKCSNGINLTSFFAIRIGLLLSFISGFNKKKTIKQKRRIKLNCKFYTSNMSVEEKLYRSVNLQNTEKTKKIFNFHEEKIKKGTLEQALNRMVALNKTELFFDILKKYDKKISSDDFKAPVLRAFQVRNLKILRHIYYNYQDKICSSYFVKFINKLLEFSLDQKDKEMAETIFSKHGDKIEMPNSLF